MVNSEREGWREEPLARDTQRRRRRSVTSDHQHEGGSLERENRPRSHEIPIDPTRRLVTLPAALTAEMRTAWLKVDGWATPAKMDAIWDMMVRFALHAVIPQRDGEGFH